MLRESVTSQFMVVTLVLWDSTGSGCTTFNSYVSASPCESEWTYTRHGWWVQIKDGRECWNKWWLIWLLRLSFTLAAGIGRSAIRCDESGLVASPNVVSRDKMRVASQNRQMNKSTSLVTIGWGDVLLSIVPLLVWREGQASTLTRNVGIVASVSKESRQRGGSYFYYFSGWAWTRAPIQVNTPQPATDWLRNDITFETDWCRWVLT